MSATYDNGLLLHVLNHDYEALYQEQIAEREQFHYPPFYRIIELTLRHRDESAVVEAARLLQRRLQGVFAERVSGVVVPSIARVQNQHIRLVRLRIESGANIVRAKQMVAEQIDYVQTRHKRVQIIADVDPQ